MATRFRQERLPWHSQPQEAASAETQGFGATIISVWTPTSGGFRDARIGDLATMIAPPSFGPVNFGNRLGGGIAADAAGSTNRRVTMPLAGRAIQRPCSITLLLKSNTTNNTVILEANGNSGFSVQTSGSGASNAIQCAVNRPGIEDRRIFSGTGVSASNEWKLVTFVWAATDAECEVYVNGVNDTATRPSNFSQPDYGSATTWDLFSRGGAFGFPGAVALVALGKGAPTAAEARQLYEELWGTVFAPQINPVPVSAGGGGSTITATASVSAAIQAARAAAASVNAAIQSSASQSASVNAAIAQARTVQASLDAAVLQARNATTSVDAAIRRALSASASVDGVIQARQSASSTIDAAVVGGRSTSTSINGYVQAGAGLNVALDAFIQAGSSASASVGAAIEQSHTGNATIDAAISRALSASASLAAAVQDHRTATASISAQIQAGTSHSAMLDAAIRAQQGASAAINAAVSLARSASASLGAVIALHMSVTAAVGAAIRQSRASTAGVSAYVYSTDAPTVLGSLAGSMRKRGMGRPAALPRINRSNIQR